MKPARHAAGEPVRRIADPTASREPHDHPADPTPAPTDLPVIELRRRHDGWTAERQRTFLTVLAETGCISDACTQAGVSSRSAYRLRQRPDAAAFAAAWDQALRLATLRLTTIAFERAIKGTVREFWKDDERVGETRAPSDKLLTFLLGHLLPRQGAPSRLDAFDTALAEIRTGFPAALAGLADHSVEMVPIVSRDFFPAPPGDPAEDS